MFFENLEIACAKRGITPTALAKELGISTSNVTNWKNNFPKGDVIIRLSEFLDVSCDFLLTGKECNDLKLNAIESIFLTKFRTLSEFDKAKMIGYVECLSDISNSSVFASEDKAI